LEIKQPKGQPSNDWKSNSLKASQAGKSVNGNEARTRQIIQANRKIASHNVIHKVGN
jgi:hypothetical protein